MYQANVVPIVDYILSVWGYANYDFCVKVQHRDVRYWGGGSTHKGTITGSRERYGVGEL